MPSKAMLRTSGAVGLGLALVTVLIVGGRLSRTGGQGPGESGADSAGSHKTTARAAAPLLLKEDHSYAPLARIAKYSGIDSNETEGAVSPRAAFPFDQQKLVWTGQLSVEVKDAEQAVARLETAARELGGYLTGTQLDRQASGVRSGQLVMRIPAVHYTKAGQSVRGLGKVLSESSNVEDVTKAYADLEAHLKVKRETERRVRDLLALRTGTIKDVLEAEKELARIRGEIDTMEGERRWYEHQVRFSNITVSLQEPVPIGLSRPSAWASLADAFRDSAGILADSLAFLFRAVVYLLPWSLVVLLAALLYRRFRGGHRQSSQPAPIA